MQDSVLVAVIGAAASVAAAAAAAWGAVLAARASRRASSIDDELHPDRGRSLRDAVDRVDSRVNEIIRSLRRVHERIDQHTTDYEAHAPSRRRWWRRQ